MKCPLCQNDIPYSKFCPYCKKNIIVSKKIYALSDAFYNKSLRQVKNNELSAAIINLKKSITLCKTNINARNLLGLIYYKIGKMGDALKHWVISSSYQKSENRATDYLILAQQNPKTLDMYNDSIKFYNLALNYINQNNDDIGTIQLKKSLELNPDFIDALNLLALCYIYQDESTKAKKLLEHVLEIDNTNPTATKYYKDIFGDIPQLNKNKSEQKTKNKFINLFNFSQIAIFLSGIFFGIIIIYILVYPTQIDTKNKNIAQLEKELDTLQENYDELNKKYNDEIPKLKQENDILTKNNIEYHQKILEQEAQESLDEAEKLYKAKKFAQAADILYNLDTQQINNLSNQALILKNKVYPKTSQSYYDKALSAYKNKNYTLAKENFEKALIFSDGSLDSKINYYLDKINSE